MSRRRKKGGIWIGLLIGFIIGLIPAVLLYLTQKFDFDLIKNHNSEYEDEYIKTTSDKVKLNVTGDYIEYAEISINDGKLVVETSKYNVGDSSTETKDEEYESATKTFSIEGEKAKYIASLYYQPGANTHIIVLTESGKIYMNNVVAINNTIDTIDDFKETKYSKVDGIIKVENDNSNSEAPDPYPYHYAAIIDNEPVEIELNS